MNTRDVFELRVYVSKSVLGIRSKDPKWSRQPPEDLKGLKINWKHGRVHPVETTIFGDFSTDWDNGIHSIVFPISSDDSGKPPW